MHQSIWKSSPRTQTGYLLYWNWIIAGIFVCQILAAEVPKIENVESGSRRLPNRVLDYMGFDGPQSDLDVFSRSEEEVDHVTITVSRKIDVPHPQGVKILLVLEEMVCDFTDPPNNNSNRTYLFVDDGESYREFCGSYSEPFILSENKTKIKVGISQNWKGHALIRATAYYDADGNSCDCHNDLAFCCRRCSDMKGITDTASKSGYCMNRDMNNYHKFCPCGLYEYPDPTALLPTVTPDYDYEDDPGREDSPTFQATMMMLYLAIGIIAAGAVIYFVPFFCCRRKREVIVGPPPNQQTTPNLSLSVSTTMPPHRQISLENPPPPYQAPSEDFYTNTKEMYTWDESESEQPPPPSYESVVMKE